MIWFSTATPPHSKVMVTAAVCAFEARSQTSEYTPSVVHETAVVIFVQAVAVATTFIHNQFVLQPNLRFTALELAIIIEDIKIT